MIWCPSDTFLWLGTHLVSIDTWYLLETIKRGIFDIISVTDKLKDDRESEVSGMKHIDYFRVDMMR
jgi:hypothetical protein